MYLVLISLANIILSFVMVITNGIKCACTGYYIFYGTLTFMFEHLNIKSIKQKKFVFEQHDTFYCRINLIIKTKKEPLKKEI